MEVYKPKEAGQMWAAVRIPLGISGEDVNGERFVEFTNALLVRWGAVAFETIHELNRGSTLRISHEPTTQETIGRVLWIAQGSEGRADIWAEVEDARNFWSEIIAYPGVQKAHTTEGSPTNLRSFPRSVPATESAELPSPLPVSAKPQSASALPATESGSSGAVPPQVPRESSAQGLPTSAKLTQAFIELVESALEANLGPAVEQLTNEIRHDIMQLQSSVQTNLREQVQNTISTFRNRLATQGIEVVTRNEEALVQKLDEILLLGIERLEREAVGIVSRARQAEIELTEHLTLRAEEITDRCCSELKRRSEQAMEDAKLRHAEWLLEAADRMRQGITRKIVGDSTPKQ